MTRLLRLAAAALVCGFVYLIVTGIAVPKAATGRAMFIVSAVALLISLFAVAFAATAAVRLRALRSDLAHLARSVDVALANIATHRKRDYDDLATEPQAVESASFAAVSPMAHEDGPGRTENVVPHPAAMRNRQPVAQKADEPGASREVAIIAALDRAAAAGSMEISLAPVISTASGEAAGFDVLAHLRHDMGPASDLWRFGRPTPSQASTAERLLASAAIEAARRPNRQAFPLHVAISDALLGDRDELALLLDALRRDENAARSLILTLPMATMRDPAGHAAALARLAATGPRLAAEGWPRSMQDLEGIWRAGVSFVRLPAERLLNRGAEADDGPDGETVLATLAASAMAVIATGIRDARDAAALSARGVTMTTAGSMGEQAPETIASSGLRHSGPSEG